MFVAVWRLTGDEKVQVPKLPANLHILYPADLGIRAEREGDGWNLIFPRPYMACILAS
jgi:hypothetical protein